MNRLQRTLCNWLGVTDLLETERKRAENAEIALALELTAKTETVAIDHANLEQCAVAINRCASITHAHATILKRWGEQSETLRHIEARHKTKADGSKILSLPGSKIIGGD